MTNTDSICRKYYKKAARHPIIIIAVLCAFVHFLTYCSSKTVNVPCAVALCCVLGAVSVFLSVKTTDIPRRVLLLTAVFFISELLFMLVVGFVLFAASFIAVAYLGLLAIVLYDGKALTEKNIAVIIMALGFLVRLAYVLYTDCTVRQHDVEQFGSGIGHAGYIEYIYNNFALPDFDVRDVWQFYHPPLHHIVAAAFLRFTVFLGGDCSRCLESIQTLTLFYSSLCTLFCCRIFSQLKLKGRGYIAAVAVCALSPVFTVFAGSINNDVLSVTFAIAAIYNTLRWIESRSICDIFKIAFCIGLGMFTKLSVWMVTPGVAAVFLIVFIADKRKHKFRFYLKSYFSFAAVCLPLGLYWSMRNYLLYRVPFTYVPSLGTDSFQYVGNYSALKRLFVLPKDFLSYPFMKWGEPYYEYNPTSGLLRTMFFGEAINDSSYPQIAVCGRVLYWFGLLTVALCIMGILYMLFKAHCFSGASRALLLVTFFLTLGMYYYFCFTFPFTCTQNARYAATLVPIGAVALGVFLNRCLEKEKKHRQKKLVKSLRVLTELSVAGVSAFSVLTYLLLAI